MFNGVGDGGRDLYAIDLNSLAVERLAATLDYEVAPSFSPAPSRVRRRSGRVARGQIVAVAYTVCTSGARKPMIV